MPLGKGAQKALRAMRGTYGKKKGTSVFYATKNKYGNRKMTETSFYKKGGKQRSRKKK